MEWEKNNQSNWRQGGRNRNRPDGTNGTELRLKYKSKHITHYNKCKWSNCTVKRQGLPSLINQQWNPTTCHFQGIFLKHKNVEKSKVKGYKRTNQAISNNKEKDLCPTYLGIQQKAL